MFYAKFFIEILTSDLKPTVKKHKSSHMRSEQRFDVLSPVEARSGCLKINKNKAHRYTSHSNSPSIQLFSAGGLTEPDVVSRTLLRNLH